MKKIIPNFYQLFLTCFLVMSGWTAWGQTTYSVSPTTTTCPTTNLDCTGQNGNLYIGNGTASFKLQSTGINGNQLSFKLTKCDNSPIQNANGGWYNIRAQVCTDPVNTSYNNQERIMQSGSSEWNFTLVFSPNFTSGSTTVICAIAIGAPSSASQQQTGNPVTYYYTLPITVTATTTTPTAPLAPTSLSASANSSSQIGLTWNASGGATSYKVFRNGSQVGTSTGTSYTDTGLSASTSYCYTVQACNGNGCSSSSNQSCATTSASGGGCTLSLNPTSNSVISTGGSGSFTVNATTGQGWSAFSLESWLSINSGINGNGNGTVSYAVANNTGIARSGTFTINCGSSSQTFTINQAGSSTSTSTLTVNQAVLNFVASGLPDATIDVTSNTSWSVAVDGNPSWVSGLGWSGTGNNQFSVEVQPNTGTNQRTATMRVRTSDNAVERVITITQEGANIPLVAPILISPANQTVFDPLPNGGIQFSFNPNGNSPSINFRIRLNKNNGAKILERDIPAGQNTILFSQNDLTGNGVNQLGLKLGDYVNWRIWAVNPANTNDNQTYTAPAFLFNYKACYKLPFPVGEKYKCTQSISCSGGIPRSNCSHVGLGKYAVDFQKLPGGSIISAARNGKIKSVKQDSNERGCSSNFADKANYVIIDHQDGTEALYLHIQHNGALVLEGTYVSAGTPIAKMGNTGYTCGTTGIHLHFQVQPSAPKTSGNLRWYKQSIPISFSDVDDNNGIPQYMKDYIAGVGCEANEIQSMYIVQSSVSPNTGIVNETNYQFSLTVGGGNTNPINTWVAFLDYGIEIPMSATSTNTFTLSKVMSAPGINRPYRFIVRQEGSSELVSETYNFSVNFNCSNVLPPLIQPRLSWCDNCPSYTGNQQQRYNISHIVIHHTAANNNANQNWANLVKSYYSTHVKNGWGDIGYHYLIAPNGVIYAARPETVRGAHAGGNKGNDGTIGIAMIGNFSGVSPTEEAISNLHHLLAWLCTKYNINPLGSGVHIASGINRNFIDGHRIYGASSGGTACPGAIFYDRFDELRRNVPYCGSGLHNIALSNKISISAVGSSVSGAKLFYKKNNLLKEIGYTDNDGNLQVVFDMPVELGDTLLIKPNGYNELSVILDIKHLEGEHIIIPLLKKENDGKVKNPKIMFQNIENITSQSNVVVELAGENIIQYQVLKDSVWQNVGSISTIELKNYVQGPLDLEDVDECMDGSGYTNFISVRFISANDTVEITKPIDYIPSSEFTDNTINLILQTPIELISTNVYVNGEFYGKLNVSNKTIKLKKTSNFVSFKKLGYKDKDFQNIFENTTIDLTMEEFSLASSESQTLNFSIGDKAQFWRSMTFLDINQKANIQVKRYQNDWASKQLKPQSETFDIVPQNNESTNLRAKIVLDQPITPIWDSTYLMIVKENDVFEKKLTQDNNVFNYESEFQSLEFKNIELPISQYRFFLTKRLAPVPVTQQTDHQTYRGLVYKFHWNQVFADPDLLPNDMEVLVTDNAGLVTYMEGDSICVKLNNCNIGLYTLTLKATHDGLERTNTVKVLFKAPLISFTKTDVACWGGEDGEIAINIFGNAKPQTVKWNNGMVGNSINTLKAATYTFTSTDANGCTDVFAITIGQPDSLYLELTPLHISCFGLQDGKSQLKVFGGTAPYTYTWRKLNGTEIIASTQNITDLDDEAFEVTVTDAKGCFKKATMLIQEPEQLKVTLKVTPPDCPTAKNGKVEAIVTGGRPPYSIEHSKGNNRFYFIATDLGATDAVLHQVLVKDANNTCVATAEIAIISYPLATATITTQPICFGDNPKVKVQYNGQVFPYHIILSNGTDTKQFNNLMDSTFIYTVNNPVNGSIYKLTKVRYGTDICEADLQNQGEAKIIIWDLPKLSRVNVEAYNCTPRQNQAQIWWEETDIVGGQAPFLYSIDGGVTFQPEPRFEALVSGNYQVLTQDANGCEYQYPNQIVIPEDFAECIFQQVPNFISPNGDGINDVLEIAPLKYYPQSIVKIMNRGGKVLFESLPGYPTLWDGTYNGQELSFGAYYIYCDLRDGSKPYRGTVSIVR
jgi:gliding motility-associated-like protein